MLTDRFGERRFARVLPRWLVPWAKARVWITYSWQHRRAPRLDRPERFTELVQRRKLDERDRRFVRLSDKVAVKAEVARLLGDAWVIPTLWSGTALPDVPAWPVPFVVKARHGCHQTAFVRTGTEDWATVKRRARGWMRQRYARWLDEWAYGEIPRGLVVEPFIGHGGELPRDYKIFVFGGRATHIQVHVERDGDHRWTVYDRDWRKQGEAGDVLEPPPCLPAMLDAAERLGAGFDFVRVDLYEVDGEPRFGELTFYPGSGLLRIEPDRLDHEWGALWRQAREARA